MLAAALAVAALGAAAAGPASADISIPSSGPNESGVPTPPYNCGGCSGTAPGAMDDDRDGLSQFTEEVIGHSINGKNVKTSDSDADSDDDGLSDRNEVKIRRVERRGYGGTKLRTHLNPRLKDTDGDGFGDGEEVMRLGTHPNSWDTDGDRLGDWRERKELGTSPVLADTDKDCRNDDRELRERTDPLKFTMPDECKRLLPHELPPIPNALPPLQIPVVR
jgi:hypothetical protein